MSLRATEGDPFQDGAMAAQAGVTGQRPGAVRPSHPRHISTVLEDYFRTHVRPEAEPLPSTENGPAQDRPAPMGDEKPITGPDGQPLRLF